MSKTIMNSIGEVGVGRGCGKRRGRKGDGKGVVRHGEQRLNDFLAIDNLSDQDGDIMLPNAYFDPNSRGLQKWETHSRYYRDVEFM